MAGMTPPCSGVVLLALLAATAAAAAGAPALGRLPPAPLPSDPAVLAAARADAARPAPRPRLLTNGLPAAEARRAARVELPGAGPFSYSGYLGVDAQCGSEMFYWYFPAQNGNATAPTMLWLQGGPGSSSMFGLFAEHGPFGVSDGLQLVPRNLTWARDINMLYVDNPVGVGFSVTNTSRPGCLSANQTQVADNLYTALQEFFRVHHEVAANEFYVAGESYGGKYAPAVGARILDGNARGDGARINLAGVITGDGLTDPASQIPGLSTVAYAFGVVDSQQRGVMERNQTLALQLIKEASWHDARVAYNSVLYYFQGAAASLDVDDLRLVVPRKYGGPFQTYLNQSSVRDRLHVGDRYYAGDTGPGGDLLADYDICKSELPALERLLDAPGVRVMLYNGQFDFIVAPVTTELMIQATRWRGREAYLAAPRGAWKLDPHSFFDTDGYVRQGGGLTHVVVRGAGHLAPAAQPERCLDMIRRFTQRVPFF